MSQADIEKKVTDYLRNSQALEDYWEDLPAMLRITMQAGQLPLTNCKPRWSAWPVTPNSRKYCRNFLRLLGTIHLSSPSVWPDRSWQSV